MEVKNSIPVSFSPAPAPATRPAESGGATLRKSPKVASAGMEKGWNLERSHLHFVEFQRINDRQNSTAKIQRTFEKRFEKINDYIEQMKAELEKITKQFPPFPPGSEERVQALRSFAYFRKMIDQLTFPPREDNLDKEVNGLAVNSGSAGDEIQLFRFQADITIQTAEIQTSS